MVGQICSCESLNSTMVSMNMGDFLQRKSQRVWVWDYDTSWALQPILKCICITVGQICSCESLNSTMALMNMGDFLQRNLKGSGYETMISPEPYNLFWSAYVSGFEANVVSVHTIHCNLGVHVSKMLFLFDNSVMHAVIGWTTNTLNSMLGYTYKYRCTTKVAWNFWVYREGW